MMQLSNSSSGKRSGQSSRRDEYHDVCGVTLTVHPQAEKFA
jgi:hypothetical protein